MNVDIAKQELNHPPNVDWKALGWEVIAVAIMIVIVI